MKDVALEAGVTVAAVSLAFKRSPEIPERTRERIFAIAERLGYRKSPYISAHMASRRKGRAAASSPVLAFVTAEKVAAAAGERDIAETYFEGAAERAAARGYRLERFVLSGPGSATRRLGEILYARNIDGVLIAPLPERWKTLEFPWECFAVVALGFGLASPQLNRVACDPFHSMIIAVEQCLRLGYRRIGLAAAHRTGARLDRRWIAAFLVEQRKLQEAQRLPPLLLPNWSERRFLGWLEKERPDAVISPWAGSLEEVLEKKGVGVPKEVGLVTLDSPSTDSPVAGIFQNRPLAGSRAIDLLAGAIERNERGRPQFSNTLLIDGVWQPGRTVRGRVSSAAARLRQIRPDAVPVAGVQGSIRQSGPVSMGQLARSLDLHVSTVSLCLSGSQAVSPKTRDRVLLAARRLGYRPNPYVSRLMAARRSGRLPVERPPLAFVTAFPTPDGWRRKSRLFTHYFDGARERASAKGFALDEVWAPPRPGAGEEVSEELRRRQVQGLLLAPLPSAGARLELHWEWFCTVGLGFTLSSPSIHRVANDHYSAMRRAVRECHRLGYRRIGLALSATASARVQYRWLGSYLVQQQELKDIVPLEPLIARNWTRKALARWLDETRPEAIIASSPTILLHWLKSLGYTVPGDVGVVSLNPDVGSPLSGSHERAELLGARAADALISLIERGKYGISDHPNTLLVDGVWNPGSTVMPRKQGPARRGGLRSRRLHPRSERANQTPG